MKTFAAAVKNRAAEAHIRFHARPLPDRNVVFDRIDNGETIHFLPMPGDIIADKLVGLLV